MGYKNSWLSKLANKYRFVIMTDSSFEEKASIKTSRLNVLLFFLGLFLVCFFMTLLLLSYTPLNQYIPGKSSNEIQHTIIKLSLRADSLEESLKTRDYYLNNIHRVISGEAFETIAEEALQDSVFYQNTLSFEKSIEDSLLRITVEAIDQSSIYINENVDGDHLMFFAPIKGIITDFFNPKTKHFGVDLVAKENSRISSVLDGRVVISHWSPETGFVIAVQDKNYYLSLYKHNSLLLKSVCDFVRAGQNIAIIGNSGELSSGPHLHFELWCNGRAVNPENYISF